MRRLLALLSVGFALTGCVPPNEALHDATLSTAPDAPGYLVIGLAEQNYVWNLANWTQSLTLTLTSPNRAPVLANRRGCGSITGLVGDKPCELSQVDWVVLQLPPGQWTPAQVTEAYHAPDGDHQLDAKLPPAPAIAIRPGEIAYAGDYVFASSAVTNSIALVAHARNDAAAQQALAPYTHLKSTPAIYRGPGG